jgi:predicted ATPase with chaperone activity
MQATLSPKLLHVDKIRREFLQKSQDNKETMKERYANKMNGLFSRILTRDVEKIRTVPKSVASTDLTNRVIRMRTRQIHRQIRVSCQIREQQVMNIPQIMRGLTTARHEDNILHKFAFHQQAILRNKEK